MEFWRAADRVRRVADLRRAESTRIGVDDPNSMRNAFRAFYPTDRDLALRYDVWVKKYPKSYVAPVARAVYYQKIAYEERGGNSISETSDAQLAKMDDEAIRLDPTFVDIRRKYMLTSVAITPTYEFNSRLEDAYTGNRVGSGSAFGLINQTEAPLAAYNLANFRARISSTLGWSATFFINNLTDKQAYLENVAELGLPNAAYNRVATNQPRTIGADLDYRF